MKTAQQQKLIHLIDANYKDIMDGAGAAFDENLIVSISANKNLLEKLSDKPVLQHIINLHMQSGANFHANEYARILPFQNEIISTEELNADILIQALRAENFKGNRKTTRAFIENENSPDNKDKQSSR